MFVNLVDLIDRVDLPGHVAIAQRLVDLVRHVGFADFDEPVNLVDRVNVIDFSVLFDFVHLVDLGEVVDLVCLVDLVVIALVDLVGRVDTTGADLEDLVYLINRGCQTRSQVKLVKLVYLAVCNRA